MLSFLHTADLHLGLRITRFDPKTAGHVREARFQALDTLLAHAQRLAQERKLDFLLVAGDLFDDHAVDAEVARRAFKMFNEKSPAPVFVLPGNHDPLLSGGVWDRQPWSEAKDGCVRLLRWREPVAIAPNATLLPCPVERKTSMDDPTGWIEPSADGGIRIGVAHGSLRVRADLPPDDHLISRHAVRERRLDYLALGHWHGRQCFPDPDGVERTAYSGVHEPMGFYKSSDLRGWLPYSTGGIREEFLDSGRGEALHVQIAGPGAAPVIEPISVGHLTWMEEERRLNSEAELADLINEIANRPDPHRRLLRLKLAGVLPAAAMLRLGELTQVVEGRYLLGELDHQALHLEPTEAEVEEVAGHGILRRVVEKLREETQGVDAANRLLAERAILLLYEIAKGVKT
jgi:DNA repair exonuclease SbcCD nuclease subunit